MEGEHIRGVRYDVQTWGKDADVTYWDGSVEGVTRNNNCISKQTCPSVYHLNKVNIWLQEQIKGDMVAERLQAP